MSSTDTARLAGMGVADRASAAAGLVPAQSDDDINMDPGDAPPAVRAAQSAGESTD